MKYPYKTIRYRDVLNDDFAGTSIRRRKIDEKYRYTDQSCIARLSAFVLYYLIACPLVFLASKTYLGLRVRGRRALRAARGQGCFLYANHTRDLDAFIPAMAAFPRRAYIVCNPDAVSIKGLRTVARMLGALPLPDTFGAMRGFVGAVDRHIGEGRAVTVFPEAHIWPFCTEIRPFTSDSFRYPTRLGAPVFTLTTTYRRRWLLFFIRKPAMTVTVSGPFEPDMTKPIRERCQALRDSAFNEMTRIVKMPGNVEYIHYERVTDDHLFGQAPDGTDNEIISDDEDTAAPDRV